MNPKVRAYLELVRLPNLFTAAADVSAGFFFAAGQRPAETGFAGDRMGEWMELVALALASMCLYAGGVALNDVCDAETDAEERPARPIPSGRVSLGEALKLSVILLAAGVGLAAAVSWRAAGVAALLVVAIVVYDVVLKRTAIAPGVMGLCRGLNLLLGMHGAASLLTAWALRPAAILWLYVTGITFFARTEARESGRWRLVIGAAAQVLAIAGLWTLWGRTPDAGATHPAAGGTAGWPAATLAAVLGAWIAFNGLRAVVSPTPLLVQRAVKRAVLSIVVLDSCIAWVGGGPAAALVTLVLLIPAVALGRTLRVT